MLTLYQENASCSACKLAFCVTGYLEGHIVLRTTKELRLGRVNALHFCKDAIALMIQMVETAALKFQSNIMWHLA